jgi:PAS domain S-box-containing protein
VGIEPDLDGTVRGILAEKHCEVLVPPDRPALCELARAGRLDLVLVDADTSEAQPGAITREIKALAPQTIVMLLARDSSVRPLVEAMRAGAYDLFLKPVAAADLRAQLHQAVDNKRRGLEEARRNRQVEATARQHAREVLEVKSYLENLVETAGDAIVTVDLDGQIASWNRGAREILGYAKEEIRGSPLLALASGQGAGSQLITLLADARRGHTTVNAETVWSRKDCREITVSLTVSPIADSAQRAIGVLLIARDITERKKLQEELFHAEKLASIGQLAAGVAHQINNPLGAISGRAQMLARLKAPVDAEFLRAQIGKVQQDCARIAETINDLLGFARKSGSEKQYTDVNTVLDETLEMVKHEIIAHKVRIERRFADDLPLVVASANHLRQLFSNLMTNAFDAMEGSGTLTLTSRRCPADPASPAPAVEIAFTDTGTGIPEENLPHLFEPFFTTKPPGKGTGLGLAVARRILDFHNGRIEVHSQVGVGTTFTIQLPAEA